MERRYSEFPPKPRYSETRRAPDIANEFLISLRLHISQNPDITNKNSLSSDVLYRGSIVQ